MKIQVSLIPEEGRQIQYRLDGDWYREYLQKGGVLEFRIRLADVAVTIHKVLDAVTLDIRVETSLDLDCGRCLESFLLPVRSGFRYTLVPSRAPEDRKEELSDEDISFGHYQDDLIDLDALVFEQILLQVPMKPLCVETCRGLCVRCGVNLNAESCACKPGAVDGRLDALKTFKARKQP